MSGPQEVGKGGKSQTLDLNLTPMIDLMTVLVTFLLMTAVWTNLGRITVDQSVQKPNKEQKTEPPKRLTIMLDNTGYMVKFADDRPEPIAKGSDGYDTKALSAKLGELKLPKDQKIVVAPEDKVEYNDMIEAMDACTVVGLTNIVVADAASVASEMM
jgi:biopolymer transport protein ExbD